MTNLGSYVGWETEKEEGYLRGEEGEFLTLDCCPKIAAKNDRIRIMNWNAGSGAAAAQPASRFFLTINLEGRSKLNEKVISLGRFFTFWEGPRSGIKSGGSLFHKVTFSGRNLIYFKNSVLFSRIQQLSWRKCQILFTSAKSQLRFSSIPTWIQFNRSIVNNFRLIPILNTFRELLTFLLPSWGRSRRTGTKPEDDGNKQTEMANHHQSSFASSVNLLLICKAPCSIYYLQTIQDDATTWEHKTYLSSCVFVLMIIIIITPQEIHLWKHPSIRQSVSHLISRQTNLRSQSVLIQRRLACL